MKFYNSLTGGEFLLLAFAAFIDLLNYVLAPGVVLNSMIAVLAGLVIAGGLFGTGNMRIRSLIAMYLGEIVPFVNLLPLYTGFTYYMLKKGKGMKDETKESVQKNILQLEDTKQTFAVGASRSAAAGKIATPMKKIFVATLLMLPVYSFAAAEIVIVPKNPGSLTPVTVRVQDFATDINSAEITWIVNGKQVEKGVGITTIETVTGAAGTPLTIAVQVRGRDGIVSSQSITIRPIDIDLLWQANTYVPPFYKGKALMSGESQVTVAAEPHIGSGATRVSKENLIYTWKVDGKINQTASGFGKHTLIARHNMLRDTLSIELHIETRDGRASGDKILAIPLKNPEIHFYEESPLRGTVSTLSLDGGVVLTEKEGTVRAEPYFFSLEALAQATKQWSINKQKVLTGTELLTLKQDAAPARGEVSFQIEAVNRLLQSVTRRFILQTNAAR